MIEREITKELVNLSKKYPVVTITGPRQSGKTTLVKNTFPNKKYFNLEAPDINELAISDPRAFLKMTENNAILDEIQNTPVLLSYIQGIVDENKKNGQFILTGSRQMELDEQITQSLAGRTALLKLLPFSIKELEKLRKGFSLDEFLLYGFYPRIHDRKLNPTKAYSNYYETYIQRDLRQLINIKQLRLFKKFVRLCAGRTGKIFVASNLANEVGVSVTTIQSWVSILETSYIIFMLEPFYANIKKRLIRSPKLYFYDVGLAVYLLGIENIKQVQRDPLRGALVENLVVADIIKTRYNLGQAHNINFYRDSHHNEVDVLFSSGSELYPIEIKSADTYNKEYLKNLKYISKIFPDKIDETYLVYTGDLEHKIKKTRLLNYRSISEIIRRKTIR